MPSRAGTHWVAALVAAAVVAASALPRVLLADSSLPTWLRPFTWSDLLAVYPTGGPGAARPYFDVPFAYPPLVGYISGLLGAVADQPATYVIGWSVVVAGGAAGTALMLSRHAGTRRTLAYWALSPQLFLYAGLNMDVLPAGALAAAAVLARRGQALGSSVALAVGAAAKLFPLVSAPLLGAAVARDRGVARAAVTLAAFGVLLGSLYLPALLAPHSTAPFLLHYAVGHPSGGAAGGVAVWGLVAAALEGLGVGNAATVVLVLTTAGFAATYLLLVVPRARRSSDPAVGFALATIALLLWWRLYSPQFSLWVLPFFVLLPLPRRTFAVLAAADVAVFLTASPLTLVRWSESDIVPTTLFGALAAAVVVRHVALLLAWRDVVRCAEPERAAAPRRRGWRPAAG